MASVTFDFIVALAVGSYLILLFIVLFISTKVRSSSHFYQRFEEPSLGAEHLNQCSKVSIGAIVSLQLEFVMLLIVQRVPVIIVGRANWT